MANLLMKEAEPEEGNVERDERGREDREKGRAETSHKRHNAFTLNTKNSSHKT